MATGDRMALFLPYDNEPPASAYATLDLRNVHPVLDFDAATDEEAVFSGVLPANYGGGGLTVRIGYSMTSATSGDVVLDAQIERIGDQQLDVDADSFAAVQSATVTVPGTSGNVDVATITFTSGAQMDSLAAGEQFRIKVRRDANNGSDTATGDLEFHFAEVKET